MNAMQLTAGRNQLDKKPPEVSRAEDLSKTIINEVAAHRSLWSIGVK